MPFLAQYPGYLYDFTHFIEYLLQTYKIYLGQTSFKQWQFKCADCLHDSVVFGDDGVEPCRSHSKLLGVCVSQQFPGWAWKLDTEGLLRQVVNFSQEQQ